MDQRQMVKQRLRRVVEDSGVQQVTIATRIGRDKQWVYNRLRGPGGIALEDVLDLAAGLRMDPCDLACRLLRDEWNTDEEQQLRREGFGVVNRLRRRSRSRSRRRD